MLSIIHIITHVFHPLTTSLNFEISLTSSSLTSSSRSDLGRRHDINIALSHRAIVLSHRVIVLSHRVIVLSHRVIVLSHRVIVLSHRGIVLSHRVIVLSTLGRNRETTILRYVPNGTPFKFCF